MNTSLTGRLLLAVCSIIFIALGVYLLQQETITIPGRLTMNRYTVEYPGIVLFSSAAFTLSLMFGLLAINKFRFKKLSTNLFIISFVLFSIGYFM